MRTEFLILFFASTIAGCSNATVTKNDAPPVVGTVTIVIDNGDETVEHKIKNVKSGTAIEQLMRQIDDATVKISGSGATAFVTSIQDLNRFGSE